MKFSGYLLLYEDTSAIDFGPNRFTPLAGHAPETGLNELAARSSWNFRGMFGYMVNCVVPVFEAIREPVYKVI